LLGDGGPTEIHGQIHVRFACPPDITEAEWQAFMQNLRDCFSKFQIPALEQGELIAIVESTKSDIVRKLL
jgi:hypothetical protein